METREGKHTPGPWQVVEVGVDELFIATGKPSDDGYWYIAEMSKDADYANASLIASAPELLEALKGIADQLEYVLETKITMGAYGKLEFVKSVIAKAEGREK